MSIRRSLNFLENKDIVSLEDQVKCSEFYYDSMIFDYKLNDKAAKSKLVKGAKRAVFQLEENSTSINLIFNAGAWQVGVLPFVSLWSQIKGDQTCKVGDVAIKIGGIKSGKDTTGKNIVNKIVFMADRDKITCHFYNTTQKILVNGHGYKRFVGIFLEPFFQQKIQVSSEEISKANTLLLEKLGPKTVKRSDVKFKGKSSFPCNQCDYAFKSVTTLNKHRISDHASSFNASKTLLEPWHSTKNNSFSSFMMLEDSKDMTSTKDTVNENVILNNIEVPIAPKEHSESKSKNASINCDWDPCDFKSKQKSLLIKHIDEHIGHKNVPEEPIQIDDSIEIIEEVLILKQQDKIEESEDKKDTTEEDIGGKEEMPGKHGEMVENIEPLFSCDKCDFDSDNWDDVKEHKNIDIHNVHNQNKTLEDRKIYIEDVFCDFCEFRTNDSNKMKEHNEKSHGSIKCEKCEYRALDKEVMIEHMENHTGRILFICGVCEFEATREAILKNHVERKHTTREQLSQHTSYKCKFCEKSHMGEIRFKSHQCTPESKFACQSCTFRAIELPELLTHVEKAHGKPLLPCVYCEYKTSNQSELRAHIEENHVCILLSCSHCEFKAQDQNCLTMHVETNHRETLLSCCLCEFIAKDDQGLKTHVDIFHKDTPLPCSFCDFTARNENCLKEHVLSEHGDSAIITIVGNQQILLNEMMSSFQQNSESILHSMLQGQNYLKSEILLLREELTELKEIQKQERIDKAKEKEEDKKNEDRKKEDKKKEDKKMKDVVNREHEVVPEQELKKKSDDKKEPVEKKKREQKKQINVKDNMQQKTIARNTPIKNIVWVGTSISNVLDKQKVEKDTNIKLKVVKAYGIKREENQRFPASNFTDTVPKVINYDNPDAIILQTGSIEISNIDVKKALMDPFKNIEQYKNEWTKKTKDDSINLFNVAKNALVMKPDMEVIIVKRLPRYDLKSQDPLQIKQSLSEYSNSVYDQLWFENDGPKNIHIVSLDKMECFGYLKDIIYGNTSQPNYDGIHLRGPEAVRHFTYRAVNAIKSVIHKTGFSPRSSGLQSQLQRNYQTVNNKSSRLSNYSSNHDNCPQAQYQWRKQSRLVSGRVQTGEKSESHQHNSYDGNKVGSTYYSIPVQNRFTENF